MKGLHQLVDTPVIPLGSLKNISPFGPAVLPAIGNIYTNVLFYHIDYIFTVNS